VQPDTLSHSAARESHEERLARGLRAHSLRTRPDTGNRVRVRCPFAALVRRLGHRRGVGAAPVTP
jgi:hypothetical protein